MEKEKEELKSQIGKEILLLTRNELYLHMRFMDVALSSFSYVDDGSVYQIATDGWNLYYNTQMLGERYKRDRIELNRIYLHTVLHCIFRHLVKRNGRDPFIWNLACDIVVESIIDDWRRSCIKKAQSYLRQETYKRLRESMKVLTAEKVYTVLVKWNLDERRMQRLQIEFTKDDHKYWAEEDDQDKNSAFDKKWKDISEEMQTDMETFSQEASASSGGFLEQIQVENKERYDYREFLKKFAVLKEEMKIDEDTFDYGFYAYGLQLYGNMPLIEPQEWKEVKKVEEFVIVIDTSMSCKGELVKRFLEETYSILSENESFFRKVQIHIIQCDDRVQSDKKITDGKELKDYMEKLDLIGDGGTDFRPAFTYINELIEKNELQHLKGVIYFTDGQGIFPSKRPMYETAFVFMRESDIEVEVPPWAIKLVMDEEEIERIGR